MRINKKITFDEDLNPQQLEVVKSGPGPILVIAGAGSGKTRTLTYRVAHLIESGIDPYRILLLTFTNKAAGEMVNRVENIVPSETRKIWGGTFHSIANRILRTHISRLNFEPNYTILDQKDSQDLLETCLQELGHKKKDGVIPQGSALLNIISLSKNKRISVEDILDQRYPFFLDYVDEIEKTKDLYINKKKKQNLLDFDDLLIFWLHLMENDQDLHEYYSDRFQYILVDEYQDTNRLQADIIDTLASKHKNIMVVGDDSQSIYSFRGADFSNIMDFPKKYPDTKICKLEYNYRSSPQILDFANEVITFNERQFKKTLKPVKEQGLHPHLIAPQNIFQQSTFVANQIQECIYNGIPAAEIAILYRAHYHSMELQMELTRRNIQFEVRSGIRFFEQAHIKDIVSYLKILLNPLDEVAWKRLMLMMPGIGIKTAQKIFLHLSKSDKPIEACTAGEIISKVPKTAKSHWVNFQNTLLSLTEMGIEIPPANLIKCAFENGYMDFMRSKYADSMGRNEDIEQFISFAWKFENLTDLLSDLALITSSETEETENQVDQKIKLTTIHQAKGLEWTVVFIICLVEGRFPNAQNIKGLEEEEEERRLFYVASTRAKDHLFLCVPRYIKDSSGYANIAKPSRFLREIPEECYKVINEQGDYDTYY